MNPLDYAQLGVSGVTLGVFYFLMREVVRHFTATIKDQNATISNHIAHNSKILSALKGSIDKHDSTIEKLIEKL